MKIIKVQFVKINNSESKVLVRADILFEEFELRGFKVVSDSDNPTKQYIVPPSYRSDKGWRALFKTVNPQDWQKINAVVLAEYNKYLINESLEDIKEIPDL